MYTRSMPDDFVTFRRRASGLRQRDLLALARRLGWEIDRGRGKGSHAVAVKAGITVVIPARPKPGTTLAILRTLELEAQRDELS